jgi:hypothetical protein
MPEQGHSEGGNYVPGQTLRDGERVVLAHVANQDTTPRGAVSLELAITDRQAGVAAGAVPETDTCRRTRRPGYILVLAQVVWRGMCFAQDRRGGAFREVDGVDGNFRAGGRTHGAQGPLHVVTPQPKNGIRMIVRRRKEAEAA